MRGLSSLPAALFHPLGKGSRRRPRRVIPSTRLFRTAAQADPYLNVDPGTMSPYQHGEVFVTEDGAETDSI